LLTQLSVYLTALPTAFSSQWLCTELQFSGKCDIDHIGFSRWQSFRNHFYVRQHMYMLSPVRVSVCLSVTRVDHTTVEVRIMKLAPYGSLVPLVFREQVSSRNSEGFPESGGVK